MKNLPIIFLVVLFSFLSQFIYAQCPTTPITLWSQADVNNFSTTYPNCNVLNNQLIIDGAGIHNLNGLSMITESSSLIYIKNTSLSDLTGLNNLNALSHLKVESNNLLFDLTGIENLTELNKIFISDNPILNSISSLSYLTEIIQEIDIQLNPSLTSLSGLGGTILGGPATSCYRINISFNDLLTNLNGLPNVEQIHSNLIIHSNDGLITLNGLSNLKRVEGLVVLDENDMLTSLSGLHNLEYCNELSIFKNKNLPNLQGLDNLHTVFGVLDITDNSALQHVTNLNKLSVSNWIWIRDNPNLTSLTGLENVTTAERIWIENNDALISLSGLNGINSVTDLLRIVNNDGLIELSGLENLTNVNTGFIIIENNSSLSVMTGLDNLQSVLGLDIKYNHSLLNLDALTQLATINRRLVIENNQTLNSVMGLIAINSAPSDYVSIINNPMLSLCHADGICFLIGNHSTLVQISNNNGNCFDITDVAIQCGCSPTIYYLDNDGDGYGSSNSPNLVCNNNPIPPGHVANDDDCDDTNPNDVNLIVSDPVNENFYGANHSLTSQATVSYGLSERTFQAGDHIVFGPGFTVIKDGPGFVAQIDDCGH